MSPSPTRRRRPPARAPLARSRRGPAPPVPLRHPATLLSLAVAVTCLLVSVTTRLYDTDLWQHLLVGNVIWATHSIPTRQLWSWPTYGSLDVTSSWSWAFRALLWPLWSAFGVWGLYALRWTAALAAFALAWATARRLGARDLPALLVFVVGALVFRQRAQVRPELIAAVLLALAQWILETRRAGGPDRAAALVPLFWIWVNLHVSYVLGFALIAVHLAGDGLAHRQGRGLPVAATRRLALCAAAAAVLVFANPYGWRAVWQPFEFLLVSGHEPILRTVAELRAPLWSENLRNGLPVLLAGWPLLLLIRSRRHGLDPVETLLCLGFTPLAFTTWRFVGPYAVIASPYVARDLEDALARLPLPAWSRGAWARAAGFALPALALAAFEWSRPALPLGVGFDPRAYPVAACDFMESRGVRGRGFTQFEFGGYLLWRFWPERDRLPFMDIHQSGTRAIRDGYTAAFTDPAAWRDLDRRWRFEYVLVNRIPPAGGRLLDVLDADPAWALVFADDRAALWVRRSSPAFARVSADEYRLLAAGAARLPALEARCEADTAFAAAAVAELTRMAGSSRGEAATWNLLGRILLAYGRVDEARAALRRAVAPDQEIAPGAHALLALIALVEGRPEEAVREARREIALSPRRPGLHALLARACSRLGDVRGARSAWRRELAVDPGNTEARDSLMALESAR